jgi:tol-pal system protein YbgF
MSSMNEFPFRFEGPWTMITKSPLGICFLVLFLLSACVTTDEYVRLQREINQTKSSQHEQGKALSGVKQKVMKELSVVKRKVANMEKTAAKPLSGDVIDALRDSQEMIHSQLTEMNSDIQRVHGSIDENRHAAEKSFRDSETERAVLRSQLDAQSAEMEKLLERIGVLETRLNELAKREFGRHEREKTVTKETVPKTPEEMYQRALRILMDGKTKDAREAFEAFLKKYPDTDLSDNAQFWLAESFYKEGNYEEAILSYETLIKKFPKSDKVPGSMLKQAYSFQQLGDTNTTKVILSALKERFPKSKEAELADKKLMQLGPAQKR